MDTTTIWFLVTIVWFAQGVWVFFDTIRYQRVPAALAWGLGALVLPALGLIIYLSVSARQQAGRVTQHRWVRQYYYVMDLTFFAVLFVGLAETAHQGLRWAWTPQAERDDVAIRETLAWTLALVVISAPVWGFHWLRTLDRLHNLSNQKEFWESFVLHRAYTFLTLGITGLLCLGVVLFYVFELFRAIFGVSEHGLADFSAPVAWSIFAFLTLVFMYFFVYHTATFRKMQERFVSIPAEEPAVPSSPSASEMMAPPASQAVPAVKCPRCGTACASGYVFCMSCGAKLDAPQL